jgi:peroxiredoxin
MVKRILVAALAAALMLSAAACIQLVPAPAAAGTPAPELTASPEPTPTPEPTPVLQTEAPTPTPAAIEALGGDEGTIAKLSTQLVNTPVADFTLQDQNGNTWTLSDLKGKIVLLNFWATWCGPCVGEMPEFQKLYDRFGTDGPVIVLSVASTTLEGLDAQASKDQAYAFVNSQKYSYPILFDTDGTVWGKYIQSYVPVNYILDTQGNLRLLFAGAFSSETELYSALEAVRKADSGK